MRPPANVCSACGQAYGDGALFCPKDGTPLGAAGKEKGPDPYLGIELPGQIRIEQLIGVGTMGRVYRGLQSGVERRVAVKILHQALMAQAPIVARFEREARAASRVVHPNVVQVLLTGSLPDAGPRFLVLEYLDGITLLSALAASGGKLALERALPIALSICDAIGAAHAEGIVHRDLKPDNVMLVRRGAERDFVKVLDFGLARIASGAEPAMTQAGVVFGTARYVSPEGAAGRPVGPAGDVYSIATVLYEMLAGHPPFEGDSPAELLVRRTLEDAPPLPDDCAPRPIASVIHENLERRPEARAPDARALGAALVRAAHEGGIADAAVRTLPLGSAPAAARIERAVHTSDARRRRREAPVPRTRLALLIAACFLAGALAAASAWRFGLRGSSASEQAPEPGLDASDARGALAP